MQTLRKQITVLQQQINELKKSDESIVSSINNSYSNRWVNLATVTVDNTAVETSLFTTGEGSRIIPKGFLTAGTIVEIEMEGTYSTPPALGNYTLTFVLKLGTTIAQAGGTQVIANVTGRIRIKWRIVVRTTGDTVDLDIVGAYQFSNTSAGAGLVTYSPDFSVTGFTTTVDKTFDLTAQWNVANSNKKIDIHHLMINSIKNN